MESAQPWCRLLIPQLLSEKWLHIFQPDRVWLLRELKVPAPAVMNPGLPMVRRVVALQLLGILLSLGKRLCVDCLIHTPAHFPP